jgi:hypothetical protein
VHTLSLSADGEAFTTLIRVKRVEEVTTGDGERTFLLGVEFVAESPALLGMIEKLGTVSASDGEPAGA